MLRVAARRLSSLSSPSYFRPAAAYSTVASKHPFPAARSTFPAPHFYTPLRGFATEHLSRAEHSPISDVPPTVAAIKNPSSTYGLRKAISLPFVLFRSVFLHINTGLEDIIADYVHHEMTRSLILVYLRLFFLLVIKGVLVSCLPFIF